MQFAFFDNSLIVNFYLFCNSSCHLTVCIWSFIIKRCLKSHIWKCYCEGWKFSCFIMTCKKNNKYNYIHFIIACLPSFPHLILAWRLTMLMTKLVVKVKVVGKVEGQMAIDTFLWYTLVHGLWSAAKGWWDLGAFLVSNAVRLISLIFFLQSTNPSS